MALPSDLKKHLDEYERYLLLSAMRECGGNRTAVGKMLGLTLRQVRYRLARLKIKKADWVGTAIVVVERRHLTVPRDAIRYPNSEWRD